MSRPPAHPLESPSAPAPQKWGARKSRAETDRGDPPENILENETARRMLEIAERLFAEHGIEMVPLRQIMTEAGQRNRSALQYHFGSREMLVSQLLNLRLRYVSEIRHRYLDRLEAAGQEKNVRAIVEATISALADTICGTPWGPHYISVLAQATFSRRLVDEAQLDPTAISATVRAKKMFADALPEIPPKVLRLRIVWFTKSAIFSLADWCRTRPDSGAKAPLVELVDYHTAALMAAVHKR